VRFILQSSTYTAAQLQASVDKFLPMMEEKVRVLEQDEFTNQVRGGPFSLFPRVGNPTLCCTKVLLAIQYRLAINCGLFSICRQLIRVVLFQSNSSESYLASVDPLAVIICHRVAAVDERGRHSQSRVCI
jgi:hypothetical protein